MKRLLLLFCLMPLVAMAQKVPFPIQIKGGEILYHPDEKGNRVLDFSYCGYHASEVPIPDDVPVVVYVSPIEGDNALRIQKAIDYVSSLKPDKQTGRRGAVLLEKGTFAIDTPLRISTSGVVLRGVSREETVILKRGVDRGAIVYIEGVNDITYTDTLKVQDVYLPVGESRLQVESFDKQPTQVMIYRPSTKEWVTHMGCADYGGEGGFWAWKAGEIDVMWDRMVVDAQCVNESATLSLDVPLSMPLDKAFGPTWVMPYVWSGRISESGVENLSLVSAYDTRYLKDEDHAWEGVSISNARDCWVRRVNFRHLAGSAVILLPTASRVTVEDCASTEPVSEVGGWRRQTFHTLGGQNLFQRCYARQGINDYAAGLCAPGPNAFVQCDAEEALGFSGSVGAWATGLLFDVVNIDGNDLCLTNLKLKKYGAGWNTANSLVWQSSASLIECYSPTPDNRCYAYGVWAQYEGNGVWGEVDSHVRPRSIFYAQLDARTGKSHEQQGRVMTMGSEPSSSPKVEVAMQLAAEAKLPRPTMKRWIEQAPFHASVSTESVKSLDDLKWEKGKGEKIKEIKTHNSQNKEYSILNGCLSVDGKLLVGGNQTVPWWNGRVRPASYLKAKPHITRFIPGREGIGLTDRIDSTIVYMKRSGTLVLDHNYGLWYDRRRDDHQRVRRKDGDVWPPFYEQPFARSGQGTAWDGLSKYDLTRPNNWYWSRIQEFARKASGEGLLFMHQHYFQHNILEAGAHWVDCPWRAANNINDFGMPEPVHFAGDKRIFSAEIFYDLTHEGRRALHRGYIRQCLDATADYPNVIQLVSAEYTGPLHFVQFWIDVIREWEKETGRNALVALSTTKDVQDAILADPERAAVVDIIDIRYWYYHQGKLYAPEGGKNLAPRQHARLTKTGKVTPNDVYAAVSEYRLRFPDKAVTYYGPSYPQMAWAVAMAGGSLPQLNLNNDELATLLPTLSPVAKSGASIEADKDCWLMSDKKCENILIYNTSGTESLTLQGLSDGKYTCRALEGRRANLGKATTLKTESGRINIQINGKPGQILWLKKK